MQIPKKVRIGGIDYIVKFIPNPCTGNSLCYGIFDSEKCVIELNSERELTHDRLCQTFLHEILHAVAHNQGVDGDDDERMVTAMGRGLFQVIQDNPKVFMPKV